MYIFKEMKLKERENKCAVFKQLLSFIMRNEMKRNNHKIVF